MAKSRKKKAADGPKSETVRAKQRSCWSPDLSAGNPTWRCWTGCLTWCKAAAMPIPALSHSARLLSRGAAKVAQKFGEEAVECLIEAVAGNRDAMVAESADVLYHLMVLWVACGINPNDVWGELVKREGVSGIIEKAARAKPAMAQQGLSTSKIP